MLHDAPTRILDQDYRAGSESTRTDFTDCDLRDARAIAVPRRIIRVVPLGGDNSLDTHLSHLSHLRRRARLFAENKGKSHVQERNLCECTFRECTQCIHLM